MRSCPGKYCLMLNTDHKEHILNSHCKPDVNKINILNEIQYLKIDEIPKINLVQYRNRNIDMNLHSVVKSTFY